MTHITAQLTQNTSPKQFQKNNGRLQSGLILLWFSGLALLGLLVASGQLHFNLTLFGNLSVATQIHLVAVTLAIVLGGAQFVLPKGRSLHIIVGSIWVVSMLTVAVSAFFIRDLFNGGFSPIHLFIPLTLFALYRGLAPLAKRRGKQHGRQMKNTYIGALMIAGLFAFMPGRTMWQLFFGG